MPLPIVDVALRAGTTALLLLLAALLLRDFRRTLAGRLAAAFALGTAAFALSSTPQFATDVTWWRALLIAVSTGNVVVFWLFTRALFDDGFSTRWRHVAIWVALVGLSLMNCLALEPTGGRHLLGPVLNVIALGFIVLAVSQSLASWRADLVEKRRQLRVFIVASAAAYGAVNAALQLLLNGGEPPALVGPANAIVLAGIVVTVVWSLTQATGDELFAPGATAEIAPPDQPTESSRSGAADPATRKLVEALKRLMAHERFYRHEGVTIGMLATRLDIPEYRLRRLINRELGYRNFNVFLNNYRIEEAKAALSDPTQAAVPITTIALDTGFQSLGPFNRAFKTETGVTPTEYRRTSSAAV